MKLSPELYSYLLKYSVKEPEVLQQLRQETDELDVKMQIPADQGQFMQFILKLLNAKKTLDIGVFTGYSALSVALALPNDGEVIACDVNEQWTDIAKKYWEKAGVTNKIKLHLQPAIKTLDGLLLLKQHNTFDFAFIDADKTNYMQYYEKCLQLIRPGGVIAVDNVFWGGKVANPSEQDAETTALRKLNSWIYDDSRVDITMIAIGDGLTLAMKKE